MADQLGGFWELADLLKGIVAGNTPKPGTAIVRDVDADGTVWVEQSGTGEAVPANGMSVASVGIGDVVTVEANGGRLSITGNATSPAVGQQAVDATVGPVRTTAEGAEEEAVRARDAADSAQKSADDAAYAASSAQRSATEANASASSALVQLSTVQDVVGVLTWASEHGSYEPTDDGERVGGKTYYTRDVTYGVVEIPTEAGLVGYYELAAMYEEVLEPSGDPSAQGWYERSESYVATSDDSPVSGKRYYERVYTYLQTTDEHVVSGKDYYELSVDYVASTDEEPVDGRDYYELDGGDYILVEDPQGSPVEMGWYVRVEGYDIVDDPTDAGLVGYYERTESFEEEDVPDGGDPSAMGLYEVVETYALTADESVELGKRYWSLSLEYVPTADATVVPSKTYYEVKEQSFDVYDVPDGGDPSAMGLWELVGVDEALTEYVRSHLALTDSGLYLMTDGSGYRLHLASDGWELTDAQGVPVTATFVCDGEPVTRLGRAMGMHMDLTSDRLSFLMGDGTEVAYISVDTNGNSSFSISNAIVLTQLNIGRWRWFERANGNLALKWVEEG